MTRLGSTILAAIFSLLLVGVTAAQAQLTVQSVQTVDVTPSGFSVVWQASEASDPGIAIYSDALGAVDITNQFEVTLFPMKGGDPTASDRVQQADARDALIAAARAKGLMRVRVEGLSTNATVYYRIFSDSGSELVQSPVGVPTTVATHQENSFITSSNQLLLTLNLPDPTGWIVTAETTETLGLVSAMVGDGAAGNQAFLNLSQLFQTNSQNWDPNGSKAVTLTILRNGGGVDNEPAAISVTAAFAVGTLYFLQLDDQPLISVIEPSVNLYTVGEGILISWTDSVDSSSATVALFYDTDASGQDGIQIVVGLPEDQDGEAEDSHNWDTTAVPDGVYYVYAEVTDGATNDFSYSSAAVTIDRGQADGDGDQMSNLWELFHFATLANDGTSDQDSDGNTDKGEYDEDTDPNQPDVRLALSAGLNIVSFPITPDPAINSGQFLQNIGAVSALAISRIHPTNGLIETTQLIGGNVQGTVFNLAAETGYFLEMLQGYEAVWDGIAATPGIDLPAGTNGAGFVGVPGGYDAYQLLQAIGNDSVVSSIRRFNRDTGRYETAAYVGGNASGPNFSIMRGEGYLFYMHSLVNGFTP